MKNIFVSIVCGLLGGTLGAWIVVASQSSDQLEGQTASVQASSEEKTQPDEVVGSRLPPSNKTPAGGLTHRLADIEQRIALLELKIKQIDEREQDKRVSLTKDLGNLYSQFRERRLNRNLEKASKKLVKLKARRQSQSSRLEKYLKGPLKQRYSLADEQVESLLEPARDYMSKRSRQLETLLEGYLSSGGQAELTGELDAMQVLDDQLMTKLDAIFDSDTAAAVFDRLQSAVGVPKWIRSSLPDQSQALEQFMKSLSE